MYGFLQVKGSSLVHNHCANWHRVLLHQTRPVRPRQEDFPDCYTTTGTINLRLELVYTICLILFFRTFFADVMGIVKIKNFIESLKSNFMYFACLCTDFSKHSSDCDGVHRRS